MHRQTDTVTHTHTHTHRQMQRERGRERYRGQGLIFQLVFSNSWEPWGPVASLSCRPTVRARYNCSPHGKTCSQVQDEAQPRLLAFYLCRQALLSAWPVSMDPSSVGLAITRRIHYSGPSTSSQKQGRVQNSCPARRPPPSADSFPRLPFPAHPECSTNTPGEAPK